MSWDSFRLVRLSVPAKLLVTLFVLIIGPGYLFATLNIYFQHQNADGVEGLTPDDVKRRYHGLEKVTESKPDDPPAKAEQAPTNDDEPAPNEIEKAAQPEVIVTVNSTMLEQVRPGGDMREYLDEGGEPAVRGLITWLEQEAKEEDFAKAGLVQDGDPSAKDIITANCVECHTEGGESEDILFAPTADDAAVYELVIEVAEPEVKKEEVAEPAPETTQDEPDAAAPEATRNDADASPPETTQPKAEPKVRKLEPTSIKKLVHITHAHILAIPVFTFIVGALFMMTGLPCGVKLLLGPLPMLAVMLDIGSWWIARVCEPFVWVILVSGAVFGLTYALQILCILCSTWCGRRDDPAPTGD